MNFYRWDHHDLILSVHIQPRASHPGIVGVYGDQLKIKLTAPPIEGQANEELSKLLAKLFGVAKSKVLLLKGASSKDKLFRIQSPKHWPEFIAPP